MANGFRVGSWLVQPGLNTVSQNGTSTRLEPKVMEVLLCLASRPGEPVSKDAILKSVWPETFVSDDVLTRSISELRRAFEDDARDPRFIETIPKRGYRLVAAVTSVNGNNVPIGGTPAEPSKASRQNWKLAWATVAALVLVCGLLVGFKVSGLGRRIFGSTPPIHSLAVLPLQNLSGDASQDYFADGMTDEIITELSRLSSLRVISRTSVVRYKGSNKSLPEIARELDVDGIVNGSILRSGDQVRISAQLIYAPEDKSIWAQSYERDFKDILALQSAVANNIASEIRVQIKPDEQAHLQSSREVNLKAHEAYLQGRYHLQLALNALYKKDKGNINRTESENALVFFQQAIQADPNYAPYYLGMWEAWSDGPTPPGAWIPGAKTVVQKAVQLDDRIAEGHRALGGILMTDLDFAGAEKEFLRAIELAPNDPDAHGDYANFNVELGRQQKAMHEAEIAQSLDPKTDRMADAFYYARQFDKAIPLQQNRAENAPSDFAPHMMMANIYSLTGHQKEAIAEWQEMGRVLEYKQMAEAIGKAYRLHGYKYALRVFAGQLEAESRHAVIPDWFIATIYGYLGDKDRAFAHLERAYKAKDGIFSLNEPAYDPLRDDPRFAVMMKKVGLPQ